MNSLLEKKEKKMFSAIPLRTEIYDKYVTFNSSALKDIFGEVTSGITNKELWNKYFNINEKKYSLKNYSFNYQISTDGFAVSINFIKNEEIQKKQLKSERMAKASKETKNLLKTKTTKEIEEFKIEKKNKQLKDKINKQEEMKKFKAQQKKEFKEFPKEKQEQIKAEIKLNKNGYEYISDAITNPKILDFLKKQLVAGNIKVVDPGLRAAMTILGTGDLNKGGKERGNMVLFSYSSGARITATKRLIYSHQIENKKSKTDLYGTSLKDLETELSLYNSKTNNLQKFFEYFKKKLNLRMLVSEPKTNLENEIRTLNFKIAKNFRNGKIDNTSLLKLLEIHRKKEAIQNGNEYNKFIRKLKWFSYINKQRHEDELLNKLEKIYSKNAIFVFGDWSATKGIKKLSTPNMSLKRLLEKRFKVYLLDEFKTSKLCWKTKEEGKNVIIKEKYEKNGKVYESERKMHSLLTFKMSKKEEGIINRDYNATKNMYKITESLIMHKKRPEEFCRKIETKKVVTCKKGKDNKGESLHIGCVEKFII